MSIFKLTVLFFMILLANFSMLRIDFGKFFKKNSISFSSTWTIRKEAETLAFQPLVFF